MNFEAYFVVADSSFGTPNDAEFCRQVRDSNELPMRVLYDPDGVFQDALNAGPNDDDIVIDHEMKIRYLGSGSETRLENALDNLLLE